MIDKVELQKLERKQAVKAMIMPHNEVTPLSAQDYATMDIDDIDALKELFADEGKDYDEYMKKAKLGWPARTEPKPIRWRDGRDGSYHS